MALILTSSIVNKKTPTFSSSLEQLNVVIDGMIGFVECSFECAVQSGIIHIDRFYRHQEGDA
jgi:hypothetical protein